MDIDCLLADCHFSLMILSNTYCSHPRGLDLHLIAQHEPLGVQMETDLLMHPLQLWVPVVVNPFCETGHKRQKPPSLTTGLLV